MLNWRAAVLAFAALLCLFGAARADVGDVSYGPWSEWGDQPIEYRNDLFVETRKAVTPAFGHAWRYTRYRAEGADGARYAASDAGLPRAVKEVIERDAPLKKLSERDGRAVYEGDWFNETQRTSVLSMEEKTQYRMRQIFLVACAVRPAALIAEVGERVQLSIELLDPGAYSLTSDKPEVAFVDQDGLLSALAPGRARVTLIYKDQTAVCDVLVISGREAPAEGAAALRLSGMRLTVRYDAGKKEVTGLKLAEEAAESKADPEMRFLVDNLDGDCLSLRALCPRIGYLATTLSDEGAVEEGEARVLLLKEILDRRKEILRLRAQKQKESASTAQPEPDEETAAFAEKGGEAFRFRAIPMPEGGLVLTLQADSSYALSATGAQAGAGLVIRKLDLDDPLQRWTLEKEAADVAKDLVWRLPVADNSFCQITDDFKTMVRDKDKHDGVDFSPIVDARVLAVAAGRVVRVDDRCTHDFRKTKLNKYGRYIDPCDEKDGVISKYGSYGKYITIEHADGTLTMYAHLKKIQVRYGQKVRQGQVIGVMGSTGSANGTHLHFEVHVSGRAADPRYFLGLPEIGGYVP
jgi:murein DD-endopeptidase MepM/ murein hydrolase activator NlpD